MSKYWGETIALEKNLSMKKDPIAVFPMFSNLVSLMVLISLQILNKFTGSKDKFSFME